MRKKPIVSAPMLETKSRVCRLYRLHSGFDPNGGCRVTIGGRRRLPEQPREEVPPCWGCRMLQSVAGGGLHEAVDGEDTFDGIEADEREPVESADRFAKPGQACSQRLKSGWVDFWLLGKKFFGDVVGREEGREGNHRFRTVCLCLGLLDGEPEGREDGSLVSYAFRRFFHPRSEFGDIVGGGDRGVFEQIGGGVADRERKPAKLFRDSRQAGVTQVLPAAG